jgi:uncharacterized protein (TIGR02265 family)
MNMASSGQPTIKGIFVNSHVKAVEKALGDWGLEQLELKFGQPLNFGMTDNVPIRTEIKLLECAVQLLTSEPIPLDKLALESGRLHFKNFTSTPLGLMVFAIFRNKLKQSLMQANNVAQHVFQGTMFRSYDIGPKSVKVVMENNDYPAAHFQGFFLEWMKFAQLQGKVNVEIIGDTFEYTLEWL